LLSINIKMHTITLLLGTNLGEKENNLVAAKIHIETSIGNVFNKSAIYESTPWGFQSNNNFLNQAIQVMSELSPTELLKKCKSIEQKMGRENSDPMIYADRIIDIDILFYDDLVLNSNDLKIPHPRLHERKFALIPLCEIMPGYLHPKLKKTLKSLLDATEMEQSEV
jgi:2-amino-4-hydroxy-6-hydroxymethyldihydropteridine diphosphokinase